MRVQVVTRENGYGLSKDIEVLREYFTARGDEFHVTDWRRPRTALKFHWTFHLELVNPAHFSSSLINAIVPNPEWWDPQWDRHLSRSDIVLAKTRDCERIFQAKHKDVRYVGWTSPDTDARVDHARPGIIHFGGDSISKGTDAVIQAAELLPQVPVTVIWKKKYARPTPPNVRLIAGRVEGAELADLKRVPIHLCPSTYEGFGHHINEAKAMGAVIVTTNAAPMDELVTPAFGLMVPVCSEHTMRAAIEKRVCSDALAECMLIAHENIEKHGEAWGRRARSAYENGRVDFHAAMNALLQ